MAALAVLLVVAALCAGGLYLSQRWVIPRPPAPPTAPDPPAGESIADLITAIFPRYQEAARPAELLAHPPFQRLVARFASAEFTHEQLLAFYTGQHAIPACAALEALGQRTGDPEVRPQLLAGLNAYVPFTRFFLLRALDGLTTDHIPLVGMVLLGVNASWLEPVTLALLQGFVSARLERGDAASFGDTLSRLHAEQEAFLAHLLDQLGTPLVMPLRAELQAWGQAHLDRDFLAKIGHLWPESPAPDRAVLEHPALLAHAATVEAALLASPPRSVLLVGHPGTGKSTLIKVVARRLQAQGLVFFEAGANDLVAGQIYVGAFEERMQRLLRELAAGKRVVWVVPDLHALLLAGGHQYSPSTALDLLLPALEGGQLRLIGECGPAGYERLVQTRPRVLSALEAVRLAPLADTETMALATTWARRHPLPDGTPLASDATLREAAQLAEQYLGDVAPPGSLLGFLEDVRARRARDTRARGTIGPDEMVATLAERTGLPASILDDRQNLDLSALQRVFEQRIRGQPEPITALVERVAMIKAGLTDPTRPQGVFLFVGPTGTGKTEIAKTLTEFLFGSPQRMIRLDMSEFQTPESLARLIGGAHQGAGRALVDQIRSQPFTVVLLDEFEKANPTVWDLFLQVFDDGRLTDWQGNTADFRHAIIILTSNLAGTIGSGPPLGFAEDGGGFSTAAVERAVGRAFRPEFLNRLDRVVIFRPLTRETMRGVLRRELEDVFARRGLRTRSWAVEWDETAIDFLLARGFTRDLGARPLKRAIELHLLAPLARTIVDHSYPQGDQFLFVRGDGARLLVEFVDPDAGAGNAAGTADETPLPATPDGASLTGIALDPHGSPVELSTLRAAHARLSDEVAADAWHARKTTALEAMSAPAFWESPTRFDTLGLVENCDRVEAAIATVGSLLDRLDGRGRRQVPREHVGRAALRLHVLDTACADVREQRPRAAFLVVEAGSHLGRSTPEADAFAARLAGMYRAWADRRGMSCTALEETRRPGQAFRAVYAVSGFGAYTLLAPEHGLHVFEEPDPSGHGTRRWQARVRVVAQPPEPASDGPDGLRAQAAETLTQAGPAGTEIVRRYREAPSPLVRDAVRHWRTGRVGEVFDGDFDLFAADEEARAG